MNKVNCPRCGRVIEMPESPDNMEQCEDKDFECVCGNVVSVHCEWDPNYTVNTEVDNDVG